MFKSFRAKNCGSDTPDEVSNDEGEEEDGNNSHGELVILCVYI